MFFFFFNDTATTEIYTLSLHDALPILPTTDRLWNAKSLWNTPIPSNPTLHFGSAAIVSDIQHFKGLQDRKSTRLNSSHANISYAVFCLKKKTTKCKSSNMLVTYIEIH